MTTEDLGNDVGRYEAVASGTVFAPQQEEQQQEEEQPSEDVAEEQEEATEDAADDDEQPEASQDDVKPRMKKPCKPACQKRQLTVRMPWSAN